MIALKDNPNQENLRSVIDHEKLGPVQIGRSGIIPLLPLSFVESVDMHKFTACLDPRYVISARKTLTNKLLPNKYDQVIREVKRLLSQVDHIAVTLDLGSNRQMKGFLGITGNFIVGWELKSVILACKRFKHHHTADNISQEYEEVVAAFNLRGKITNIITDNASNI